MTRRRAGISAGHSDLSWMAKRMRVDPAPAHVATCAPAPPPAIVRVHHPAIKAPEHKCYRVIRRWKGEDFGECIGFSRTEAEALFLLNKELGWAIVVDPNEKRSAFNFQPMTSRPHGAL